MHSDKENNTPEMHSDNTFKTVLPKESFKKT